MPRSNWVQNFETWLRRRGIKIRGVPREPMSESTIVTMVSTVRKCMKAVGVLDQDCRVLVRARELRPEHLTRYFDIKYPGGPRGHEAGWTHDATALRKLAEYLRWGATWRSQPVFSDEDLAATFRNVYTVAPPRKRREALSEDFLDRYENQFLPWLNDHHPLLWGPAAWMLFTGMRIHEVAGIDEGLETGTMVRLEGGEVEITGKGFKGQKNVDPITLPERAEQHLVEWASLREELHVDNVALFPNHRGGRLPIEGAFNRNLRLAAQESGLFKGECDANGNNATKELKRIHAHEIGRAAFVTNMTAGDVHPLEGMKLSRHKSMEVYAGYSRTDTRTAAEKVNAARRARLERNGNGKDVDVDKRALVKELLQDPEFRAAMVQELMGGGA